MPDMLDMPQPARPTWSGLHWLSPSPIIAALWEPLSQGDVMSFMGSSPELGLMLPIEPLRLNAAPVPAAPARPPDRRGRGVQAPPPASTEASPFGSWWRPWQLLLQAGYDVLHRLHPLDAPPARAAPGASLRWENLPRGSVPPEVTTHDRRCFYTHNPCGRLRRPVFYWAGPPGNVAGGTYQVAEFKAMQGWLQRPNAWGEHGRIRDPVVLKYSLQLSAMHRPSVRECARLEARFCRRYGAAASEL